MIKKIADILYEDFYKKGKSLEKLVCVFGGKRPALFLKKELSRKIKSGFLPPVILSMDEFMEYIVSKNQPLFRISDLELYYLIYRLSEKKPYLLKQKQVTFSEFLSWAKEIAAFIDQLDLEDVKGGSLLGVQKSAAIGYEIPDSINHLLKNIVSIRKEHHIFLRKNNLYSRGMIYLDAAKKISKESFQEFDRIFFCDLFYLHKTETKVVESLYRLGKSVCIFQGSSKRWPALKKDSELLTHPIEPSKEKPVSSNFNFYEGFDTQSQVCLIKEILKEIKDKESTLILLPHSESLVPLLSEVSCYLKEFNVSLGYPLAKTSLSALFDSLLDAHQSRKAGSYYSKDYLKVLKHPLVKNMPILKSPLATRILVHKIEEALTGAIKSSVGGNLFVFFESIEGDEDIYKEYQRTLYSLGYNLEISDYRKIISRIHDLFFRNWKRINSLKEFSQQLKSVLDCLSAHRLLLQFPLELKALDTIYGIEEDFSSLSFSGQAFGLDQIWDIFRQRIDSAYISFIGSPLRGTQILGLLETRALQFKNVIVLDANEGVLPKLKITEPLIPSEVKMGLGLPVLQKEEEIQRYHFMRLVESAENVFLIWAKNPALEKSRFIEDIIWKRQRKENKFNLDPIAKISFSLSFPKSTQSVKKTSQIIKFLKNSTYSASRINTYLECPLQFYYRYVLGLGEKESLLEEVKDSQIGNFIHGFLFEAYSIFLGKQPVFDRKFNNYFSEIFNRKYEREISPRMQADSFLLKEIIKFRLNNFLKKEKERAPDIVKIMALEKEYIDTLNLGKIALNFKYIVDRIDLCQGNNLVILDYKTGSRDVTPAKLSSLEKMGRSREEIRDKIKSFQLPIYYYFMQKKIKAEKINACVYNLRTAERKLFIAPGDYPQREKVLDSCLNAFKFIISQIFDPKVSFSADRDSRRCKYCPFYNLCG